jgi:hypothetical protein
MPGGRPSKFKPEFVDQATKLAALGATDREVAEFFDVDERTLNRWKHDHEGFCQALKVGKAAADERVEQSLYRRATGYSYDAVKIFMPAGATAPVYAPYVEHTPPDTTAAIFWLKNRKPDAWRDVRETKSDVNVRRSFEDLSDAELDAAIAARLADIGRA